MSKKKKLKKHDAELQEKIPELCKEFKTLIDGAGCIIKIEQIPHAGADLTLLKKAGEDLRRIEAALARLRIEK